MASDSAPARLRANATACTPSSTSSARISAASVVADRRWPSTVAGSHRAKVIAPRGEPSSVTAVTGIPIRRAACVAGSDTVADASTNVGVAP